MNCYLNCSIGIVFVTAAICTSFFAQEGAAKKALYATLSPSQQRTFEGINKARRLIYLQGLGLGLFFSLITLYNVKAKNTYLVPCSAAAITLVTNYFYYILSPKPQSLVISLDKEKQRVAWYKVYRRMQVVYHGGLLLGIVAAYFLASGLCPAGGNTWWDIGLPRFLPIGQGKK